MRRVIMYAVEGQQTRVTVTPERVSIKVGRDRADVEWDETLGDVLDAVVHIPLDTRTLRGRLASQGSLTLYIERHKQAKWKRFTYSPLTGQVTWYETEEEA